MPLLNTLKGVQLFDFGDIGLGVPGIQNRQIMSFGDLTGFSRDIAKFQAKTNIALNEIYRKICKDLFDSIVLKTPYDTGQTKASWRMGVNRVETSTEPEGKMSKQTATTKATSQAAAMTQIINMGDTVIISNNLPWAVMLEFGLYAGTGPRTTSDGYSTQAPQGMVRASVDEFDYLVVEAAA